MKAKIKITLPTLLTLAFTSGIFFSMGCKTTDAKSRPEETSSCMTLGEQYWNSDVVASEKWFRKAAEQGDPLAQHRVGVILVSGRLGRKDFVEGLKWFRKAAAQGYGESQFSLGLHYALGEGVPQNYTEAAKWLHQAADQGICLAQMTLGSLYANGQGVQQDKVEAYKWYFLASGGVDEIARQQKLAALKLEMTPEQIQEAEARAQQLVAKRVGAAEVK